MIKPLRPLQHLHDLNTRYPGVWKDFEGMRERRDVGLPEWPEWCYVPMAGAYAVVSGGGEKRIGPGELSRVQDVASLAALAAWRMTKGVYRFDADILAALWDTPLTGELPSELLLRLPEWCVYVEAPRTVMGAPLYGFYAHVEQDANDGRRELRLLLDYEDGLSPLPIHLVGTLEQGLKQMTYEAELQAAQQGQDVNALRAQFGHDEAQNLRWAEQVAPLVSLLLYLCSERPDIAGKGAPGNPEPKRVKGGPRLFAAPGVKTWDVAYRLGAAFRRAGGELGQATGEGGRTVRAHVRKAHWHTFLSGPRAGLRQRALRWLPPTPVAFGDEDVPAVIRRVGRAQK